MSTPGLRANGLVLGLHDTSVYVAEYGAKGDGTTDDTAAINSAVAAIVAAGGGTVYFPAGNYRISRQANSFSSFYYALRIASASGANIVFQGVGPQSIISLGVHNNSDTNTTVMLDLHQSTGSITVRDLQFQAPAPSTTGQGPAAISVGNMGGAAGAAGSGTLESLLVERCTFTNVSYALHGEGAKKVTFRDNIATIKGGGTYLAGYFAEGVTLGSRSGTYEGDVLIENNKLYNDATNGDHTFYILGQFKSVIIRGNEWDVSLHDAVKFSSWGEASHESGTILVEDNVDTRSSYNAGDAGGSSTFMVIVSDGTATGSARNVIIRNNRVKFAEYFLYTEWAFDLISIEGNVATSLQTTAFQLQKNASLALRGHASVSGNNFDAVNVANANNISAQIESSLSATVMGNRCVTSATQGRFIDATTASMSWIASFGNYATKTAYWYEQDRTGPIYDFGNSWNTDTLIPTADLAGNLGTTTKRWGAGRFNSAYANQLDSYGGALEIGPAATAISVRSPLQLPSPALAAQTGAVYQGSGAPSNTNGNNGDVYFRTDTPGTANQRIYIKSAGSWVGIV